MDTQQRLVYYCDDCLIAQVDDGKCAGCLKQMYVAGVFEEVTDGMTEEDNREVFR